MAAAPWSHFDLDPGRIDVARRRPASLARARAPRLPPRRADPGGAPASAAAPLRPRCPSRLHPLLREREDRRRTFVDLSQRQRGRDPRRPRLGLLAQGPAHTPHPSRPSSPLPHRAKPMGEQPPPVPPPVPCRASQIRPTYVFSRLANFSIIHRKLNL